MSRYTSWPSFLLVLPLCTHKQASVPSLFDARSDTVTMTNMLPFH